MCNNSSWIGLGCISSEKCSWCQTNSIVIWQFLIHFLHGSFCPRTCRNSVPKEMIPNFRKLCQHIKQLRGLVDSNDIFRIIFNFPKLLICFIKLNIFIWLSRYKNVYSVLFMNCFALAPFSFNTTFCLTIHQKFDFMPCLWRKKTLYCH